MNLSELTAEEDRVLRQVSPFRGNALPLFEAYCREYKLLNLEPGQHLFKEGSPVKGLYLLVSGRVSLSSGTEEFMQGVVDAGQILGDFELMRSSGDEAYEVVALRQGLEPLYEVSARATVGSRAIFIPIQEIRRFLMAATQGTMSTLLLQILEDTARKALRTARWLTEHRDGPEILIAEAIERLLPEPRGSSVSHDPESVFSYVDRSAVVAWVEGRLERKLDGEELDKAVRDLKRREVIEPIGHGSPKWRVNRWALSDYLRAESNRFSRRRHSARRAPAV
jgi:CRP-like cAMP-binding protein